MRNKDVLDIVLILLIFICSFVYLFIRNKSNSIITRDNNSNMDYHLKKFIVVAVITLLPAVIYIIIPNNISAVIRTSLVLLLSVTVLIGLFIYYLKK
jgi:hypothetical protein